MKCFILGLFENTKINPEPTSSLKMPPKKQMKLSVFNKWKLEKQQRLFNEKFKKNYSLLSEDIVRKIIEFIPNTNWYKLKIDHFLKCDDLSSKTFKRQLIEKLSQSKFSEFVQLLKLLVKTSLYNNKKNYYKCTIFYLIKEYEEATEVNDLERLDEIENSRQFHKDPDGYGILNMLEGMGWREFTIKDASIFGMLKRSKNTEELLLSKTVVVE